MFHGGSWLRTISRNYLRAPKISRSAGILRISGTQKIQAACARVPEPISRIHSLLGLQWRSAEAGSEAGEGRGEKHLRSVLHDGGEGSAIFCAGEIDA